VLAEFLPGHPASAFDHDLAAANDDFTGSGLQEDGGWSEGCEQQEIADLAGHRALQHGIIDHPALAVDLDFNHGIVVGLAARAELARLSTGGFGQQGRGPVIGRVVKGAEIRYQRAKDEERRGKTTGER